MHKWILYNSAILDCASLKPHNPLEQKYSLIKIERIISFINQFPESYLFCDGDREIAEIKFEE